MDTNIPLQKIPRSDGVMIAYKFRPPQKSRPCIVFLGGYHSDMEGTKALALDRFCAEKGFSLLRLDYAGHGQSGGEFRDGTIGQWANDARLVIDAVLPDTPFLLIGSSMGGWIGLLLARDMGPRITGFIGIAAAPDFTDWVWTAMNDKERALCRAQGYIDTPDGDIMTLALFEDGAKHLVMHTPLTLRCPVTLLQGKLDTDVPYQLAYQLAAHITPTRAEIILIEDGDHRLARDVDLERLQDVILNLLTN